MTSNIDTYISELKRFFNRSLPNMIRYNSSPVLLNISHNNSSSTCNSKRNSLNYNQIVLKPRSSSLSFSNDSEWLTSKICPEYLRGECLRDKFSCPYAHPPKSLETQNGRVVCCFDYLKVITFDCSEQKLANAF